MSTVRIIVDSREGALYNHILQKNCPIAVERTNLDVGDIMFVDDATDSKIVIERKSTSDLASSIKDGRYRDQKARLQANFQRKNIYYIIEGSLSHKNMGNVGNPNATLLSAIVNSMMRDDLKVFRTVNVEDTADLVLCMANKVTKDTSLFNVDSNVVPNASNVVEAMVIKTKRRENITADNLLHMQVATIPGISLASAKTICDNLQVHNMRELIQVLTTGEKQNAIKVLRSVPGVGQCLADRVVNSLL